MIVEPITLPLSATLQDAEDIMSTYHVSGVPITDDDGFLLGILTNRDVRFVEPVDYGKSVKNFMTSQPLVTASVGIGLEAAKALLQQFRVEKLPLVDAKGFLKGLIAVKDIQKARDFPSEAVDGKGQLLVGAAVGVGTDLEERVQLMVNEGVDVIAVDTAHGHSSKVIRAIETIKQT